MPRISFSPKFSLTPAIAKALMSIEADRQAIGGLPLTTGMLESLRRTAQLLATHYFCGGMADALATVRARAAEAQARGEPDQSDVLRSLNAQQRKVLSLFRRAKEVSSQEVAGFFGLSPRNGAELYKRWLDMRFFELANASKKVRRYQLAQQYEKLISWKTPSSSLPISPIRV